MRVMTATELRARLGEALNRASAGERILIADDRAILIGGETGIGEEPAAYVPRTPSWNDWAHAGAYLAQLRAE